MGGATRSRGALVRSSAELHGRWWEARRQRQKEIDASIARNAEIEYLFDGPTRTRKRKSASPARSRSRACRPIACCRPRRRTLIEEIEAEDGRSCRRARVRDARRRAGPRMISSAIVLDNLLKAGVQNSKKGEKLDHFELKPVAWRAA